MANVLFQAIYFFLPAYVANTVAGILGYGRPIDLGRDFIDGKRIFGDGVTVRGTVSGVLAGTITGLLQGTLLLGLVLGVGAMGGDAMSSFIKRRLGKPRGSPLFPLDQLNFVLGGLLLASLIKSIPSLKIIPVLFLITPLGHIAANKLGYHLKLKDVPW
ncbi:MAG: CDP-2,3-bis-(O-geranylgeranyl)-sn-glycerol synthase [Candidatus Hydrothermarchaeaceae archaeon]